MLKSILCTALVLICLMFFVPHVRADSFYDSGGDTLDCVVSLATSLFYSSLPSEYAFNQNGGISYAPSQVYGETTSLPFSSIATDLYPNAQRYDQPGTYVDVPPQTTITVAGAFRNANPYPVDIPAGGVLFVSKTNPSSGTLTRLMADTSDISSQIQTTIYDGQTKTRSGLGVSLGAIGMLDSNSDYTTNLYSFTTITPITMRREVSYSFDTAGELLLSITLVVTNNTAYTVSNVQVQDKSQYYSFYQSVQFAPYQSYTFTYGGNAGVTYPATLSLAPAIITDPNSYTETFQSGEDTYQQTPDAISVIFPRTDSDAPAGWTGNQSSLPILDPNSGMNVTVIPYSEYSGYVELSLAPHVVVSKMQNNTTQQLTVHIGDPITYSVTISNTGNAPAANVILADNIPPNVNITDPENGTVCLTSMQFHNYPCQGKVMWYFPLIEPGGTENVGFSVAVANSAYYQEDIYNFALEQNNLQYETQSNTVHTVVDPVSTVSSGESASLPLVLSAFSSQNSGEVLGVVWNDANENGIYETNEHPIADAQVDLTYTFNSSTVMQSVYTNGAGVYEIDGLPLYTQIHVAIDKPAGYGYESTYSKYMIVLTGTSMTPVLKGVNGIMQVSAGAYFNAADSGVYNQTLADTGQGTEIPTSIAGIAILLLVGIGIKRIA